MKMEASESDNWHIQCIYPRLTNEQDIDDYLFRVRIFVRKIWPSDPERGSEVPPKLVPDRVECSSTMVHDQEKSTIKIRFRQENPTDVAPQRDQTDSSFSQSVEYFCRRIFDLHSKSEILSTLGLITTHSLMGVLPHSRLFKYHWIKIFLSVLVREDLSGTVLRDIGSAGFLAPWFRGAALIFAFLPTVGGTYACAWAALKDAVSFSVKEPPQKQRDKRERLTREFIQQAQSLVQELEEASRQCEIQREGGGNEGATDNEIRLFNALLDALELGFNLLTCGKEIFDAWAKEAFRHQSKRNICAGAAVGGTVVAGSALYTGFSVKSFAVLGPVGVAGVGVVLFAISCHAYEKAAKEKKKVWEIQTHIQGLRDAIKYFVGYLLRISCGDWSDDNLTAQEKIELGMFDQEAGLRNTNGARIQIDATNFRANIDSTKKVIQDRLNDMKQNESLRGFFE